MKKLKTNKLTLDRETLAPLQGSELDHVAGGVGPSVSGLTTILTRVSCLSCTIVCAGK